MAKASIKLANMSLMELVGLRGTIDVEITTRVDIERRDLESRLAALSSINTSDSQSNKRGRSPAGKKQRPKPGAAGKKPHPLKGRKAAVKYRGPGGETWSGRGLAPRWLKSLEVKGKKRESFLVKA